MEWGHAAAGAAAGAAVRGSGSLGFVYFQQGKDRLPRRWAVQERDDDGDDAAFHRKGAATLPCPFSSLGFMVMRAGT